MATRPFKFRFLKFKGKVRTIEHVETMIYKSFFEQSYVWEGKNHGRGLTNITDDISWQIQPDLPLMLLHGFNSNARAVGRP